jgi:hypothetical protein
MNDLLPVVLNTPQLRRMLTVSLPRQRLSGVLGMLSSLEVKVLCPT